MTGVADKSAGTQTEEELRALPLPELIRRWSRLVWATSVRPMYRRMLDHDLTLAELVVLRQMQRGSLTVAEAADCLQLSPSAASRAIDRLVRDGLIRREENPDDRRQKLITMTTAGRELLGDMDAVFAERQRQIIAVLDDEEQGQFSALIVRMLTAHVGGVDDGGCPQGAPWGQGARGQAREASE
jgi:MarR family transcriptional regulator, organic hydroperoxide resistance regulator